jgi:hypothetical protein
LIVLGHYLCDSLFVKSSVGGSIEIDVVCVLFQIEMRGLEKLCAGLVAVILAVLIPRTIASEHAEGKGKSHDNGLSLSSLLSTSSDAATALEDSRLRSILRPNTLADLRRHIRSVDQGAQQQVQSNEQLLEEEDGIQSNSGSPSDDLDVTHKTQRSLASTDMLRYTPAILMPRESKYPLNRWYLPGLSHFSRGGRAERNGFIRFGRNGNFDAFADGNFMNSHSHNGNKKSNFIRLGRENPRQTNFIRLGRSGLWGNGERYGSKIGFFPEYYSNMLYGSASNAFPYGDLAPQQPYDPAEVSSPQA